MNTKELIKEIINEQANIVGEKIAYERAISTKLINVNGNNIEIKGSPKTALEKLILSYEEIFGDASVEVCEDVIKKYSSIQKRK